MKPTIALTKSNNRYQSIINSLNLIRDQIAQEIKGKEKVVIKVNFVCANEPLSSTHVDAVRAVLDFLKPLYKKKIFVVEKEAVSPSHGFANFGYLPLKEKYNLKMSDYSKYGFEEVKIFDASLNQRLTAYLSRLALDSDFLISVTPAKTHDTGIVTLGLKNVAVGFLKNAFIIHQGYQAFNKNLHLLIQKLKPDLSIIDATVGMEGDGPCLGSPKKAGWSLASLDSIQADITAAYLMGFKPEKIGYLYYCLQDKLATNDWKKVKILGESLKNCQNRFKPHYAYEKQLKWPLPASFKEKTRAKIVTDFYHPLLETKIGQKLDQSPIKKIGKRLLGFQ